MKKQIFSAVLLAASIVVIPAVPVCLSGRGSQQEEQPSTAAVTSEAAAAAVSPSVTETPLLLQDTPYRVLDAAGGEIMDVSVREYVIGAVCAEMPASFDKEALKAQAVAAHTYAERQRLREKNSPTAELKGADFSNDTAKYQGYFTEQQAKQFFGSSFEASYGKISAAVDEVLPYILTYKDEPIISAFHSMSAGRTESAENAWGSAVEYLVPVDSSSDISAPKYRQETRYSKDVLRHKLETAFPGIVLGEDMEKWLTVNSVSPSGTVLTVTAGDITITGDRLRTALALRSASFEVSFSEGEAVIVTRGYGHGVGMSQYGANAMALEGKTWRDILSHYYPGCNVTVTA